MRLSDVLGNENVRAFLEDMLEPTTTKPPREKGADAIKVNGYVVHGFWRRANHHHRRHRRRALTPSEMAALPKE